MNTFIPLAAPHHVPRMIKRALAVIFLSLEQSFLNTEPKLSFLFLPKHLRGFCGYSWTKWKEKHTLLVFQLHLTPDVNMCSWAGLKCRHFHIKRSVDSGIRKQRQIHQEHIYCITCTQWEVRGVKKDHILEFVNWQISTVSTCILFKKLSANNKVNFPYFRCIWSTAIIEIEWKSFKHLRLFLLHYFYIQFMTHRHYFHLLWRSWTVPIMYHLTC